MIYNNSETSMFSSKLVRVIHPVYRWASVGPCIWINKGKKIIIPAGFLSDCPVSPGWSFFFHDFLYATHKIENEEIDENEANRVFADILDYERIPFLKRLAITIFKWNPFGIVRQAWNSSFQRGPEFADVSKLDPNCTSKQQIVLI